MTNPDDTVPKTLQASPAPLALTLFGAMQVQVEGAPLPRLRSRKALWLLALLALRGGRPAEREWLAATLWPDADQDQALASLRTVLSELRQALGTQRARLQSPTRATLGLDLAGAQVDVTDFDTAISKGTPPALKRAVSLYTGPLLEGCPEEWVGQEQIAREQDCLRALQSLAEDAQSAGDAQSAAEYWRRAVALDPWHDTARRGLMEALAQGGDANAALHVYREFVALLRDDPKAAPDERTSALYTRLRAQAGQQAAPRPSPQTNEVPTPAVAGYLPHPLTDLVGREDERLEIMAKLRRSRLVTLTGTGGIGKTRLALAVATEAVEDFADGVWLVALDALTDGARVAGQIGSVLGLKEEADRTALENVTAHLKAKRLLLVMDNCEHVLTACAQVAGCLLQECAGVRLLATSREVLGITGETAWQVPGLAVPDPAHLPEGKATLVRVLAGYEGVQLFLERAQAVQKTFALTTGNARGVAQVCAQLEGIPLALELAAARVKVMTVEQIAARLDDRLGLLTGGSRTGLSRQRTLRSALDWSYELLDEDEKTILAHLSVFAGGWTLAAAEDVCAGGRLAGGQVLDLLASLVDKSLVVFEERESGGRYRYLETIRQYAREKLQESGEAQEAGTKHRAWFLALGEEAGPKMKGPEQGLWLHRLAMEHDNLRAALEWCEKDAQGAEAGLRLAGELFLFWSIRGDYSEGRTYLQRALAREGAQGVTAARGRALTAAGNLAQTQDDSASARALHEESLAVYRELGNKLGVAASLHNLGNSVQYQGDHLSTRRHFEESLRLYKELGDLRGVALLLGALATLHRLQGDYTSARLLGEESLSLHKTVGDRVLTAMALTNLGNIMRLQGDYLSARALYEEAIAIRREMGNRLGIAWSLSSLGLVTLSLGDTISARALHEEALSIRRELGHRSGVAWSLHNLSLVAQSDGEATTAQALVEESLGIFQELNDSAGQAWALGEMGNVGYSRGNYTAARVMHLNSLRLFQGSEDREGVAAGLRGLAAVLAALGETPKAVRLWGAAEAQREGMGAPLTPKTQESYDHQLSQARAALGEDAFTAAWAAGRALTWEQAVDYALTEDAL